MQLVLALVRALVLSEGPLPPVRETDLPGPPPLEFSVITLGPLPRSQVYLRTGGEPVHGTANELLR